MSPERRETKRNRSKALRRLVQNGRLEERERGRRLTVDGREHYLSERLGEQRSVTVGNVCVLQPRKKRTRQRHKSGKLEAVSLRSELCETGKIWLEGVSREPTAHHEGAERIELSLQRVAIEFDGDELREI